MKIAIIEDEKPTAKDLAKTITGIEPDAEIVKLLHSVEEAVEYLSSNSVDLIFSDIQLGDGLSFKIFEEVDNHAPVIFCTAFNEYALEAFKSAGIDYLLKPFSKTTVAKALEKYHKLKSTFAKPSQDFAQLLKEIERNITKKGSSIVIRQGDKIIPLDSASVALFFVENENTYAYTFEQKKFLVSEKLELLESTFAPNFFRANRQFLINRKAVKDAAQSFNRKIVVNLLVPFKEPIEIGKLKTREFMEWLARH
jgi:two-component system, LytTR family, response regulator LytT